jgi:hypothetical protein
MKVKVDKGIPIPPKKRDIKFPFRSLGVGDSFCVPLPADEEGAKKVRTSVAGRVNYHSKRLGIKLVTRTVTEKGKLKIRIWRMK